MEEQQLIEQKHATVTAKAILVGQIGDHILETYHPDEGPIVLMWRETMNGFNRKGWDDAPLWAKDDKACHVHWKKYGPSVVKWLHHRGFTVAKVCGLIRQKLKHSQSPDRSGSRTDDWYKSCLPHATKMVRGIVVFPRDNSPQDHPLLVQAYLRRGKSMTSGLTNVLLAVDAANGKGVLSDGTYEEVRGEIGSVALKAIEDKTPLFSKVDATKSITYDATGH